jgi:hypothetical protein
MISISMIFISAILFFDNARFGDKHYIHENFIRIFLVFHDGWIELVGLYQQKCVSNKKSHEKKSKISLSSGVTGNRPQTLTLEKKFCV